MSRSLGLKVVQALMLVLRKELEDLAANSNGRFALYVRSAVLLSLCLEALRIFHCSSLIHLLRPALHRASRCATWSDVLVHSRFRSIYPN